MLRPASSAIALAAASLVAFSVTAAAANPPAPPPGSVQVQPVSTSAGGNTAGVSTGQTWASSDSQSAAHCGVAASAGGTGYSAQPQQFTSSGSGSPNCPSSNGTSSTSGQPSGQTSGQTNGQGNGGAGTQGRGVSSGGGTGANTSGATPTGKGAGTSGLALKPAASTSPLAALGQWFGWLFLLLLAAFLFVLLGFALGRRRRQAVAA